MSRVKKSSTERQFAPIDKILFLEKINEIITPDWDDDDDITEEEKSWTFEFTNRILDDTSIMDDWDDIEVRPGMGYLDYPCGYKNLPNGMHAMFITVKADWSVPLCFVIYWDGEELRAYVPREGNIYNRLEERALTEQIDFDDFDEENEDIVTYTNDDLDALKDFLMEARNWVSDELRAFINKTVFTPKNANDIEFSFYVSENAIIHDIMENISKNEAIVVTKETLPF